MIFIKSQKNKSKKVNHTNDFAESFEEIKILDIKDRNRLTQRQILAVKEFVLKSREKNPSFTWNNCPWPVQFLPVIVNFFSEWEKINAINPVLSGFSGLMGMSKMEMNNRLNEKFRPNNLFFNSLPKSREILEEIFRKKYNKKINFPVIFKPNVGERATGVTMIREDQIDDFLKKNQNLKEIIFEEFVDTAKEFGLSWIRHPEKNKIEILSLVQKNVLFVVGNGDVSLKELIIEKVQNSLLSPKKIKKILAGFSNKELSEKIIGEKNIVHTASVSYATSFQKIKLTSSKENILEKLVFNLLKNSKGISAGRFDLKAKNLSELLDGKCLIIEMNGVGGLPLEIYDHKISISDKYKIVFDYFSRVFEIADANIKLKKGEVISKLEGVKTLSKLFFGKNKTQELPENVWENLREVIKLSIKGRIKASVLGEFLLKIKD